MEKNKLIDKLKKKNFSKRILKAFSIVQRERFVPDEYKESAYEDIALPIGYGQTISQPQTIAFMLDILNLENKQKILEIGAGSGYVLALIAHIAPKSEIYGTEIVSDLADRTKDRFSDIENVIISHTPGKLGLPEKAPFDRILVSAAAELFPDEILVQLEDPGILVCPVANSIIRIEKNDGRIFRQEYPGFSFVKLHVF